VSREPVSTEEALKPPEVIGPAHPGLTTCIGEPSARTPWPPSSHPPHATQQFSHIPTRQETQDEQHPEFQSPTSTLINRAVVIRRARPHGLGCQILRANFSALFVTTDQML
jgi:hypothetical protein